MITTLAKVKLVLNIEGTDKDALITALIPMVEEDYLAMRGIPFEEEDGETVYPLGSETTAIRMIEFRLVGNPISGVAGMVASESLSRYSVSYTTMDTSYPKSIVGSIKRYVNFV